MAYPYMVLGVAEDAPQENIRSAYLRKVREFSPEHEPKRFQEICEAYELIKDDVGRARLRTFGMPISRPNSLAELVPESENRRKRIGIDLWLKANREDH